LYTNECSRSTRVRKGGNVATGLHRRYISHIFSTDLVGDDYDFLFVFLCVCFFNDTAKDTVYFVPTVQYYQVPGTCSVVCCACFVVEI
jgi:hypothetical protein